MGAIEEEISGEVERRPPRRGSTLEGRVRYLLDRRGFSAVTNKIVLDHEIDVWAEDKDGRIILVECKEYYDSGRATPAHIRNFFGKVYDIETNYGASVYMSMFVSVGGFTDAAQSLCERLGIMPLDLESLEMLESSGDELTPRHMPLEDKAILELRKQSSKLREELNRRQLVRQLSERIEEYTRKLQTRTIPSFLVPSSVSRTFWYSKALEIPFVGINGQFQDFTAPSFPHLDGVIYQRRRFFGQRTVAVPISCFRMESGVIYVSETGTESSDTTDLPLKKLRGAPILTLDRAELGTAADFLISFGERPIIECVAVKPNQRLREKLNNPEFTLPGERLSLQEVSGHDGWAFVAHVREV